MSTTSIAGMHYTPSGYMHGDLNALCVQGLTVTYSTTCRTHCHMLQIRDKLVQVVWFTGSKCLLNRAKEVKYATLLSSLARTITPLFLAMTKYIQFLGTCASIMQFLIQVGMTGIMTYHLLLFHIIIGIPITISTPTSWLLLPLQHKIPSEHLYLSQL